MDTKLETTDRLINLSGITFSISYANTTTYPGAPELVGPHVHNCYEFYINFSGNISFLVNNNIYKISSGDVIFSKPTDVHHCICNETCPHEHFCVWIDTGANSELDKVLKGLATGILRTEKESRKEELFNNLSTLHSLFETENHFAKTALLFSVINTAINNNAQISVNGEPLPKNLQNILNYMNENFANIQYINEIQSKFFISSSTLNRWFKQYIHLSPHEFLEAKKLGYAEQLLQKGFSVTETAEISGFPDTSHFISVFKRKFGTTPHKYKKV